MAIPKVIHYCWFGDKPLGEKEIDCIRTWSKYFEGYEIKCWNQDNYDVAQCAYVKEAYQNQKWAFVSDYARLDILYRYGGVYFDTDVEVVGSFEAILNNGPYMGIESVKKGVANVNPGLGMASVSGLKVLKEILDTYKEDHFILPDGSFNYKTIVERTTECLVRRGLKGADVLQNLGDITIYPSEYFNPIDQATGLCTTGNETRSIHHFGASWQTEEMRRVGKIKQDLYRRFRWMPRRLRSAIAWTIYGFSDCKVRRREK